MRKGLIGWLWMVAGCLAAVAQVPETYVYALRDTHELRLDVYRPSTPRADRACAIYVFGGGFVVGQRNDSASVAACRRLAEKGFTAISIDYRLGIKGVDFDTVGLLHLSTPFRRAIEMATEDVCEAVSYVCRHAQHLGIDRTKIVLTGSSAGAIAVLQADYCRANGMKQVAALPADFVPMAVIPYAGGVYCRNWRPKYKTPPAPTCFFHGTTDRIVNYKHFRANLKERLNGANTVVKVFKKNKYPYWILRFTDRGHEVAGYLPYTIEEFCCYVDQVSAGRITYYDASCEDKARGTTIWTKMGLVKLYLH
ncbi:MAG: alpha/beta hydrolase [Bacteroidales bacterium]|nr:alpha/beta hydrolase [Bacteroidales bacterium]